LAIILEMGYLEKAACVLNNADENVLKFMKSDLGRVVLRFCFCSVLAVYGKCAELRM